MSESLNLRVDAVLIDDDPIIHYVWREAAVEYRKKLLVFSSISEFAEAAATIPKQTPLFVDSDLKSDQRGEVAIKIYFDRGFREIYLVTGHSREEFDEMPWIKSILGKDPIWKINSKTPEP